jgi:hypothetical protein
MKVLAASLLALALLTSGAEAGSNVPLGAVCAFDIQQYCKDIRRARTRELKACLAKHEKDLFPRCQDHYKDAR